MAAGPAAPPPLRGRERELAALHPVLDVLGEGRGSAALVLGEAGSGKTRLLQELQRTGDARGHTVVLIDADEHPSMSALAALLTARVAAKLVDAHSPDAEDESSELPVLSGAAGSTAPVGLALVQDLQSVLERGSALVPVVVLVDDVDRADELTIHALRLLISALQTSAVAWVMAARTGPAPQLARLRAQLARVDGTISELSPLTPDSSRQVASDILGKRPSTEVLRRVEAAGGNPFLLTELVRAIAADSRTQPTAQPAGPSASGSDLPQRAMEAVQGRVAELSTESRHILEVASVLGRSFLLADVLGVLGRKIAERYAAVSELLDSGLIVERGQRMVFAHDLVREGVRAGLPAQVVRLLHRDIANYLLDSGHPAVDVAAHILAGSDGADGVDGVDARASATLLDAARRSFSSNPHLAVDMARKALAVSTAESQAWLASLPEAFSILVRGGELDEASTLLTTAIGRGVDPEVEANMRVELGDGLWLQGRTTDAMLLLQGFDGTTVPEATRIRLDVASARLKMLSGRARDAVLELDDSLRRLHGTSDLRTRTQALVSQAMALRFTGDLNASLEQANAAVRSLDSNSQWPGIDPRVWVSRSLVALDRLDEGAALLSSLIGAAQTSEGIRDLPPLSATAARLHLARGQLEDAVAEAEAGIAAMDATGRRELAADLIGCAATAHWLVSGTQAANAFLQRSHPYIEHNSFRMNHLGMAHVLIHGAEDPAAVLPLAEQVITDLDDSPGQLIFDPMNGPALARPFARLGITAAVDRVLVAARRLAEQNSETTSWSASFLHVDGLLRGDPDALLQAATRFDEANRPTASAFAVLDAAIAAADRGDSRSADLARRASTRFRQIGAAAVADDLVTVSEVAPADDAAASKTARKRRPASGWDSLTPAELRVVRLAATGATNKEIAADLWISPYTVDSHMRHSLAKLGLRSRVALARYAAHHELD